MGMKRKFGFEDRKIIGNRIREHLISNRIKNTKSGKREFISRPKELAMEIGVDPNTIYKVHSGDFSETTLQLIEHALGRTFDSPSQKVADTSDEPGKSAGDNLSNIDGIVKIKLGGYSKEAIYPYLGKYIAVSRGVSVIENFLLSLFIIEWDEHLGGAKFKELKRFTASDGRVHDYTQDGTLHLSTEIKNVHLLTANHGALRLITLTGIQRDPDPVMYGAILTQVPEPGHYKPAKSTIHFRKISDDREVEAMASIGPIAPGNPLYEKVERDLKYAEEAIYTR